MKLCEIRSFFPVFCFLRQDEVAIEVSAHILIQQSRKGCTDGVTGAVQQSLGNALTEANNVSVTG